MSPLELLVCLLTCLVATVSQLVVGQAPPIVGGETTWSRASASRESASWWHGSWAVWSKHEPILVQWRVTVQDVTARCHGSDLVAISAVAVKLPGSV